MDEDRTRRLYADMEFARQGLKVPLACSSPLSHRRNFEAKYYQAYKKLVNAGLEPKLRAKYRG